MDLFIHNKNQIFIPTDGEIFGSKNWRILFKNCDKTRGCHRFLILRRTYWKAIDYEGQRCDDTQEAIDTSQCMANFIRDQVGCYAPIQYMEPGGRPLCDSPKQFSAILELVNKLQQTLDETRIHKITGCLSSCEKVTNDLLTNIAL